MKKLSFAILAMLGLVLSTHAQENNNDGKWARKPVPYPALREADVIYARRVVRIIDTREKKNQVMTWPQNPLNRIIYNLVTTGEAGETGKLKAYRSDSLIHAMTVGEISQIGGGTDVVQVPNDTSAGGDIYDTHDVIVPNPFDYTRIKRWQITEDWIFDKQRSMFFPRIVAIAPLYQPSLNGVLMSEVPLFYVSYADLRPLLVNEEVFNRQNNAMMLSYYDYFEERLFSSYITKVSNDKDFAIKDYPEYKDSPMDALFESERLKNEIADWEQDLWEQ